MFCSDIFQPGRTHGTCSKHDLTGARIERFQQLDHTTHRVCGQHWDVHDDLEIVH